MTIDEDAVTELVLFIDNDGDLYRKMALPIAKNLVTKMARGTYEHSKAPKAFAYLVEAGAKKYVREVADAAGSTWHVMFPAAVRRRAAEDLADSFEALAHNGAFDYLLPKKYQRKANAGGRALELWLPADHPVRRASGSYPEDVGSYDEARRLVREQTGWKEGRVSAGDRESGVVARWRRGNSEAVLRQ